MAFTQGNDLNIIQASDTDIVSAGAGNDTYIISPYTIGANQTVTISDSDGTNTLQLVGGLTISSSQVLNNALQLTLSNGAKVNLLNASTFGFDVGGNALAGQTGTSMNYSTFASDVLNVTVPAAGEPAVTTTTPVQIVDGGGTTPPSTGTFTLTANAPTVAEGNGGTTTLTYSVSLDKAATEVVDVAVAVSGTATAGTDFVAPASTLSFAVGETTKTFNVTVNGDTTVETDETVVLTFSGAKLAASVTATGTITNDDVAANFTLTTATTDNIVGTVADETITGVVSAAIAEGTLQGTDVIDGAGGNDTFRLDMQKTFDGFTTGSMKNVETVNLTNKSVGAIDFVAKGVTGATSYVVDSTKGAVN